MHFFSFKRNRKKKLKSEDIVRKEDQFPTNPIFLFAVLFSKAFEILKIKCFADRTNPSRIPSVGQKIAPRQAH